MSSTPRTPARTFARALKWTMSKQGIRVQDLAHDMHVSQSTLSSWRNGAIPDPQNLALLVMKLDAQHLVELARKALERTCGYCGRTFVQSHHTGQASYCSKRHRALADGDVKRAARLAIRAETFDDMKGRVQSLETELEHVVRERDEAQAAIDAFCWACSPEGVCRDATSPLRSRSPLPLAEDRLRIA